MKQYQQLVQRIFDEGHSGPDRTGTGTLSVFGHQMRFNLNDGFPLVTTKKTFWRGVVVELLWMLRGSTNIAFLNAHGVTIWDEWAAGSGLPGDLANGDLGPIYGAQWRRWQGPDGRKIDQIQELLSGLRRNPYSRRHVLNAWNVADLPEEGLSPAANAALGRMALAPCHVLAQFYYRAGRLSCQIYQRSADVFLGLPFNIASYALLTCLLAHRLGYQPGELVWTGGDCHLYTNHLTQANELLGRDPLPLPTLLLRHEAARPFEEIEPEECQIIGYAPHSAIPAPVAI